MPAAALPADHRAVLVAAAVDPSRAILIGEGWTAAAYRVGDTVVRVLLPAAFEWGVEAHEREPAVAALLVAHGLPVPREMRAIRNSEGQLVGLAHPFIEGRPAWGARLHGRALSRFARDTAAVLTRLHRVPVDQARRAGMPEVDLGTELYPRLVDKASPFLGPRGREWLSQRLSEFLADGGSAGAPRVPVHGDISGDHFLITDDGTIRGLIDLTDAMIADPAVDFAGLLNDRPWSFVRRVLAAYRGPASDDLDLERRARFYIEVSPIYQVVYGYRVEGGRQRALGLRRIAARAAAATRQH